MSEIISKITQYISEYKFLCIAFVILCIITAIMCIKAGKAVKKNNAEKEEMIKKLDRMKMIRDKYSEISAEEIKADDGENLFEGIVANIQTSLEKNDDINSAFETLSEKQKTIYAADYFYEDGKENADDFFKAYDKPLTPYAVKAVYEIFSEEFGNAVKKLYDAYDNDNETSSLIPSEIEKDCVVIKSFFDSVDYKAKATEYIKKYADDFASYKEAIDS